MQFVSGKRPSCARTKCRKYATFSRRMVSIRNRVSESTVQKQPRERGWFIPEACRSKPACKSVVSYAPTNPLKNSHRYVNSGTLCAIRSSLFGELGGSNVPTERRGEQSRDEKSVGCSTRTAGSSCEEYCSLKRGLLQGE